MESPYAAPADGRLVTPLRGCTARARRLLNARASEGFATKENAMPMITVQLAGEPNAVLAEKVQQSVTGLTAEILGKDPKVTAVVVEFISPRFWFIAGKSAEARRTAEFFVDVRITDGTNTKDEKARYIAETYAALSRLLGGGQSESYVHVNDVRADGYGYGGLTQERRYIQGRAAPRSAT